MRILPEEKYLNMKNSWLEFEKARVLRQDMQELLTALVPLINHLEVSEFKL